MSKSPLTKIPNNSSFFLALKTSKFYYSDQVSLLNRGFILVSFEHNYFFHDHSSAWIQETSIWSYVKYKNAYGSPSRTLKGFSEAIEKANRQTAHLPPPDDDDANELGAPFAQKVHI